MQPFLATPVRVLVPATSANLGPGFDALGLALDLHDEVVAEVTESGVTVEVTGEGAGDLPGDGTHLVARCALAAFEVLGLRPPGLRLSCHNRIPQARGLGSSSAATVAGILAARALIPDGPARMDDQTVLALAAGIEGHPDNVAACLLGGLTIAWYDGAGSASDVRAVRLEPAAVPVTILVPVARALTAAPALLLPATEDRLHQPYRAAAMPATAALVALLRGHGVPAVVSGAGPSVLAFAEPDEIPVTPGWSVSGVGVDPHGARSG